MAKRPCPGCTGKDCTTLPCRIKKRLWEVLTSWEGTRYMDGQSCRGVAADCEGFVVGVLDELYGITEPRPKRYLAKDTGVHDPGAASAALLRYLKRYPFERAEDGTPIEIPLARVKPGDIVIVKSGHGEREGAGHAMIIGVREGTAWHCGRKGGHVGEVGLGEAAEALAVWRPAEQTRWLEVA